VVVPDGVDRGGAQQRLQRRVLALVAVARAVLRERAGAELGARHHAGLVARNIGVDGIAHEQEEVGAAPEHRAEDPVAALLRSAGTASGRRAGGAAALMTL